MEEKTISSDKGTALLRKIKILSLIWVIILSSTLFAEYLNYKGLSTRFSSISVFLIPPGYCETIGELMGGGGDPVKCSFTTYIFQKIIFSDFFGVRPRLP